MDPTDPIIYITRREVFCLGCRESVLTCHEFFLQDSQHVLPVRRNNLYVEITYLLGDLFRHNEAELT